MKKTKLWLTDAISFNRIRFETGQKVVLFRRKGSGYPKQIEDSKHYTVKNVIYDDLIVYDDSIKYKEFKIHSSYFIPVEYSRNETIDEILKDL